MTSFFRGKNPKVFSLAVTAGVLGTLLPHIAHAQSILNPLAYFRNLAFSAISRVIFGACYAAAYFAAIAIAFEAWALGVILKYSALIAESVVVEYGFPAALSIANLAFILGIVVIAIMTILRVQSYGIKQILWKLIVMAIVVNFGLVIADAILEIPHSLTDYFLREIAPAGTPGGQEYDVFARAIAGAFNPQRAFWNAGGISGVDASTKVAATFGAFLNLATPLLFSAFFLIAVVLTLGAMIVMLVIRYVFLGYLLVLLPLAWAGWVFPITQQYWSKWWDKFMKQAFFPVFMVFFLWLAVLTSTKLSQDDFSTSNVSNLMQGQNGMLQSVAQGAGVGVFDVLFGQIAATMMQAAIVIGIAISGLFTAQAMGIAVAGGAMKSWDGMTKGFGKWAGNKGKRIGTLPLRSNLGRRATAALQRVPGLHYIGNALSTTRGYSEKLVSEKKKSLGDLSLAEQARRFRREDRPGQIAALANLSKAAKSNDTRADALAAIASLPEWARQGINVDETGQARPGGWSGKVRRLRRAYGQEAKGGDHFDELRDHFESHGGGHGGAPARPPIPVPAAPAAGGGGGGAGGGAGAHHP